MLVTVLAGAVGAESAIKAVHNAHLPKGSVTVEEVQSVAVEAAALNSDDELRNVAKTSDKSMQDVTYAMH
jgi:hypothetical protein